MQTVDTTKITIRFSTEWRGDGGLRVYATEPTGLYVSSKYTYAAAEYFQNLLPVVIVRNFANPPKKHIISISADIEWEDIVAKGGGTIEFEFLEASPDEIEAMNTAPRSKPMEGDFPAEIGEEAESPEIELKVHRRESSKGTFVVAHDFGEADQELENIIMRQETLS